MTKRNTGKNFEARIARWLKDAGYYYQRFFDARSVGRIVSARPADFWVFNKPNLYYIECKSTISKRIPFSNLTQLTAHSKAILSHIKCYFFIHYIELGAGEIYAIESSKLHVFIFNAVKKRSISSKDAYSIGILINKKSDLKQLFG